MKQCHKCKHEKEDEMFSKDSGNKDGLYSWCKECVRLHQISTKDKRKISHLAWRIKNKEKIRRQQRAYDKKRVKERTLQRRMFRLNNPEIWKARQLKRFHNITLEDYNLMFLQQNGVCAICGKEETIKNTKYNKPLDLAVDHDHKTNKIRGLLCACCNKALGMFYDNVLLLNSAIAYLEKHNVSS